MHPAIAANLGHADTTMTERHYAHLAPSYVADTIRAAMPSLGIVEDTNVVWRAAGRAAGLSLTPQGAECPPDAGSESLARPDACAAAGIV